MTKSQSILTETKVRKIVQEEIASANLASIEYVDKKFDDMKDFMFNLVDKVLVEIQEMRAEHATNTQAIPDMREQLDSHEERIEKLESPSFSTI